MSKLATLAIASLVALAAFAGAAFPANHESEPEAGQDDHGQEPR